MQHIYVNGYHNVDKWCNSNLNKDLEERFPIPNALIFDFIPKEQNPFSTDVSLLSLYKKSPLYDRGEKVEAEYLYSETDTRVVVKKEFLNILEDRDIFIQYDPVTAAPVYNTISNSLTKRNVTFSWLMSDGSVAFSKTEVAKEYTIEQDIIYFHASRIKAIDWLIGRAMGTPLEDIIPLLFDRYREEMDKWFVEGGDELGTTIATESDTTPIITTIDLSIIESTKGLGVGTCSYVDILEFPMQQLDGTFTLVKDEVLYQIGYAASLPSYTYVQLINMGIVPAP